MRELTGEKIMFLLYMIKKYQVKRKLLKPSPPAAASMFDLAMWQNPMIEVP